MADLHYDHGQNVILNFINDAVDALTDSIPLLAGQFFASLWARFLGKRLDTFQNASNVPLWQGKQILGNRLLENQPIFFHALEGLSEALRMKS